MHAYRLHMMRGVVTVMKELSVAIIILTLSIPGCGGGPSGPSGTSGTPTLGSCTDNMNCPKLSGQIGIFFKFFTNDSEPYSFTFAGQSFSGTGTRDFQFLSVSGGDYEVSGQMQSRQRFTVLLAHAASSTDGGVRPGSVQHLEGPLALLRPCGVEYQVSPNATLPQTFKFKFTVDPSLSRLAGPDVNC